MPIETIENDKVSFSETNMHNLFLKNVWNKSPNEGFPQKKNDHRHL